MTPEDTEETKVLNLDDVKKDVPPFLFFSRRKLYIALVLGMLFLIMSSPSMYKLSNSLLLQTPIRTTFENCPGIPTNGGLVVHSLVMASIAFLILSSKDV